MAIYPIPLVCRDWVRDLRNKTYTPEGIQRIKAGGDKFWVYLFEEGNNVGPEVSDELQGEPTHNNGWYKAIKLSMTEYGMFSEMIFAHILGQTCLR